MTTVIEWDMDDVVGFTDATCTVQAVETEAGQPDANGLFPASVANISLDNSTGQWSVYNADGTLADRGVGYELAIWAHERDTGINHWLFHGTVTAWNDVNGDTVVVEAHDVFSRLARPIGTYTPGSNGQTPAARLEAILTAASAAAMRHSFTTGIVTLTAQQTTQAPLAEMQVVTISDGEPLLTDPDGTLRSFPRTWRDGRPDQTSIPVVSDNVCTADFVAWQPSLNTGEVGLADTVILENIAKLHSVAPAGAVGSFPLTRTGLQYTTQAEGDTLAQSVLDARQAPRLSADEFTLHLTDPLQNLWPAVEWRRLDRLRFLHEYRATDGSLQQLDLNMIIDSVQHSIVFGDGNGSPWQMVLSTTRATGFNTTFFWNNGHNWNDTGLVWGFE